MLGQARVKIRDQKEAQRISVEYADLNTGLEPARIENASVVMMCWTLQFIRPLNRDRVTRWIYDSLVDGGVLIATEKILTNSWHMNRFFIDLYYDFKRRNNYSAEEIRRKRRVHAGWNDVLLGLCPSLPNLRRRVPLFVRLVHRYYGTVRLLLNVHVRRSVYGLRGPVLLC